MAVGTKQKVKTKVKRKAFVGLAIVTLAFVAESQAQKKIVVDANGKGNFKTIQEAINSLPDSSPVARTIFIKKGTYKEKIFIAKHHN